VTDLLYVLGGPSAIDRTTLASLGAA
jgi:hypothetical protein